MLYLSPRTLKLLKGLTYSTTEYANQILPEQGLEFGDCIEAHEKPLAHARAVVSGFDDLIEKYDIEVAIAPGGSMLSTYSVAGSKSNIDLIVLVRRWVI